MENAAQSSKPGAKVIHLRPPDITSSSDHYEVQLATMIEYCSLESIDQLLQQHFT
jgi:hypothetical protein